MTDVPGDFLALVDSDNVVVEFLLMTPHGCYKRDERDWIALDPDEYGKDDFEEYDALKATRDFQLLFDSAEETGGTLRRSDVR